MEVSEESHISPRFPDVAVPGDPPEKRSDVQPVAGTRVETFLFPRFAQAARYVADQIAELIRQNLRAGQPTRLGLPTGSTPVGVYRELIRKHQNEGLDFRGVTTFNLDEYFPMDPDSIHSYRRWMDENFFAHVNIPEDQIHIPRGDLSRREVEAFCRNYEQAIEDAGGIDLLLLGIGRTGHIGFNEPGSPPDSRTRLVTLDPLTRRDAASHFFAEENVPPKAITMGIGTIRDARRVIVMALGEHKADVVRRAVEEEPTSALPASYLQWHPRAEFVVDTAAAARLSAVVTPWKHGPVDWTPELERRAVIWLCEQTGKSIHKLETADFLQHHLIDLIQESGPIEHVRERVFDHLEQTFTTTPAGTETKTVLVFSPHPDDDVISMGGTLITLASQGHDVHIAYMTSGNIAVFDHDALRHTEYVAQFLELFGLHHAGTRQMLEQLREQISRKTPGDVDHENVLAVKALIRQTEALAAAREAGVPADRCHFLNLPFYRTGEVRKRPIGQEDVQIIVQLLNQLSPDQVYLAGDLSDPHGTHRMCAQAIFAALEQQNDGQTGYPEVWLYRGAWQEYEPHEIDRCVPLSPEIMRQKKRAIFRHESQKDAALFPGHDTREFWVRAEQRTKRTAELFNALGLPEYFALEGFRRWEGKEEL